MCKFSNEFLQKTITVWQPYTAEPLSLRSAQEITKNMTDLFSLLSEWKERNEKKANRSESDPATTKN